MPYAFLGILKLVSTSVINAITPARAENRFIVWTKNIQWVPLMGESVEKKHTGKCYDCGGALVLVESDFRKGKRIMQCQTCGLFHFHKKDFIGNWKLLKVSKNLQSSDKEQ